MEEPSGRKSMKNYPSHSLTHKLISEEVAGNEELVAEELFQDSGVY